MTSPQSTNTIAAIATASGVASIAIIRLSGSEALAIAQKIAQKKSFDPRQATLTSLYNQNSELIDQAIIIYFQAPFSFTGEDIVEFQCHGGLVIATEILETTLYHGARLAQPGEFSKRAFINGKIDLTKAEAIAKLIETKSLDGAKILAKQLKGDLKNFIDDSREMLLGAIAHSEVMIDYADEDIPHDIIANLQTKLCALSEKMQTILEASHRRKGLIEGFKVAIIGKPNVGKSSLLNALLSYERAIVSDIAGTTRDTIEEQIKIGTHIIRLVDTAGIREASDAIEKIGVSRSISSLNESDIVIALFDGSQKLDKEDEKIISLLNELEDTHLIVAINKSDLEQRIDIQALEPFNPILVSAIRDFKLLTTKLLEILNSIGQNEELMLISSRQIDAITQAKNEIDNAQEPLNNEELEFFSYHLQNAITSISSISQPYNSQEILDTMFGEFCLGK
ncbi:MAG: tRNA uridine-5-carboxymethylaminomethyl(34) synthesis GTPase MnmE [Campylobacterales bacterium]|nr:tRNA uridine-5-carboxymethylaminomethyl(34) synthesis GTPase MnmE [Campylobacterales bacterium]